MRLISLFLISLFFMGGLLATAADVVVFSYDRPMQLYAFLESLYLYTSGIHETTVIFRCSDQDYRHAYGEVMNAFPQVKFVEQRDPPHDFKTLFLEEVYKPGSTDYIAFAVDDIIVKDYIDFSTCIEALEATGAYGFYLRLGLNVDDCWSAGNFEGIPPLTEVRKQIYIWQFKTGIGGWAYPNTVDMTLYRKKEIGPALRQRNYSNPNFLESCFGEVDLERTGLCYESSKIVNIPLNIVSSFSSSWHANISAKDLLVMFNEGSKIDISRLFQIKNRSQHMLYTPTFVPR